MYGPWWSVVLRGVLLIALGAAALAWPDVTLVVLIALFGAFLIVEGIVAAVGAVVNRQEHEHWGLTLLAGLLSFGLGLMVFAWPGITALALQYLIAAWAIVFGLVAVFAPLGYSGGFRHAWLYVIGGLIAIAIGIVVAVNPGDGAVALAWLLGLLFVLVGVSTAVFGFRLRSAPRPAEVT
jgi:uncharacterized membrane protein HdeD (DUF308 family)